MHTNYLLLELIFLILCSAIRNVVTRLLWIVFWISHQSLCFIWIVYSNCEPISFPR